MFGDYPNEMQVQLQHIPACFPHVTKLVSSSKPSQIIEHLLYFIAKVLQESQEENSKLKREVVELKGEVEGTSVDISSLQTTPSMAVEERCFLSQPEDGSMSLCESYEYVNVSTQGESFASSGIPHCELHIKVSYWITKDC